MTSYSVHDDATHSRLEFGRSIAARPSGPPLNGGSSLSKLLSLILLLAAGCAVSNAPQLPADLTAATYNLRGLSAPQKLRDDFRLLASVDIWAFQEVNVDADGLAPLAELLPPGPWWGVGAVVNGTEAQAIVSRWPITAATVWPLKSTGPKRRAALVATVDAPGGPVAVVCVDVGPTWLDPAAGGDLAAASLVARLREELPDGPAVVMGDFNTAGNLWRLRSSGADARRLRKVMASVGFFPCEAASGGAITYRGGLLRLTLDHAFARGLTVLDAAPSRRARGSDHLPLVVGLGRRGND